MKFYIFILIFTYKILYLFLFIKYLLFAYLPITDAIFLIILYMYI